MPVTKSFVIIWITKRHTSSCSPLDFKEPIDVPQHLLYQTAIAVTELKIHCQVSDGIISSSIEHQPLGLGCTKAMPQLC
jgi:hypothetical protein